MGTRPSPRAVVIAERLLDALIPAVEASQTVQFVRPRETASLEIHTTHHILAAAAAWLGAADEGHPATAACSTAHRH